MVVGFFQGLAGLWRVSIRDKSHFVSYLGPFKSQSFGFLDDLLMSKGKREQATLCRCLVKTKPKL